jgi:hypothetical protein
VLWGRCRRVHIRSPWRITQPVVRLRTVLLSVPRSSPDDGGDFTALAMDAARLHPVMPDQAVTDPAEVVAYQAAFARFCDFATRSSRAAAAAA